MSSSSGVWGGAPAADAFLIVSMQKLGFLKLFYMTISVLQFPQESFIFLHVSVILHGGINYISLLCISENVIESKGPRKFYEFQFKQVTTQEEANIAPQVLEYVWQRT